jgi:hypothetical protein
MENQTKKINQMLARNQVISSIVWAIVLIACSYTLDSSDKNFMYIIMAGFFVEMLRISTTNKVLKKTSKVQRV